MAAEELEKISLIGDLTSKALQEYEGLQRKHETTTMECKRLEDERDEAVKRLNEFHQVSQLVIEEVTAIQENLEIEKQCRESAEALASKLNRQNRSLKRKSIMLLSHLSPETITEISLEDEEEDEGEEVCLSTQSKNKISGNILQSTLKEKNQAVSDLEAVREQLKETREELLKKRHENTVLMAETVQQKKILGKYNRVSQLAVEEYGTLLDTLNLERDLRTEAENFARAMVVEQKALKRQSQIMMCSSSPSQTLQEALSQVTILSRDLERQKLEHQNQIKQLEDRLSSSEAQKELKALRYKLELVEEERRECNDKCSKAQLEVKDLRFTVEELQKKLQAATNPQPAPAPPPPPPLPPPAPATSNPLSALLSLIRKRRDVSSDIPLVIQDSENPEVDVRQQAVEEMMQRIKKGIQLRPVSQLPNTSRKQMERLPSNSAIQELKGIMGNFKRSSPQPKIPSFSTTQDEELQRILLRRRDVLESQPSSSVSPFPDV
ncbi:shootin-1 [Aulostomus maculatus]